MYIIELNIFIISNIFATVISLFLGIHFLFLMQGNKRTNRLLGCFLMLMSFSVFGNFLEDSDIQLKFFDYLFVLNSSGLITLILMYYSFSLTRPNNENITKYRWLIIFPLIEIIINLFVDVLYKDISLTVKDFVLTSLFYISFIYNFTIYFIILKEIKIHNKNILKLFSSIDNKQLNWLKLLVLINIGFMIIWFVDDTLSLIAGKNIVSEFLSTTSYIGTVITILWIGFSSLRQNVIYQPSDIKNYNPLKINDATLSTYPDIDQKYKNLSDQIVKEKLFLDQDISLGSLADIVNLKPKDLSLIINKGFGSNFYHFINYHRVQHYKYLLEQSDFNLISIEGRAYNCGFNSKSTFYTAFKKIEKMTPREYELMQKGSNKLSRT